MEKIILIKYLNNKCSNREFEEFVIWLKKESNKIKEKNWSLDHWNSFESKPNTYNKKKFSTLLDKIHHHTNFNHRKKEVSKVSILSKVTNWLRLAAVIQFVPLIGIVFYILPNSHFQINKITDLTDDSIEVTTPVTYKISPIKNIQTFLLKTKSYKIKESMN